MNTLKRASLFSCLILLIATLLGCATSPTATSTPQPTSESRNTDGFEFLVNVNNTHPRLGGTVVIMTDLENISNTNLLDVNIMEGQTSITITNEAGEIVWGVTEIRRGTASYTTLPIGYNFNFGGTWTATKEPYFTIPITAGTYTLSVSDTGFFDPSLNMQVPFSVTPIVLVVTG